MFQRVISGSEGRALAFLQREPDINYFLLGDIEAYSLEDPNLALWMDGDGTRGAALLRYYAGFLIYAPDGADYAGAARIMRDHGFSVLSGRPEYVQPLIEQLRIVPHLQTNVLLGLAPEALRPRDSGAEVLRVDWSNVDFYLDGLVELRRNIPEFNVELNEEALRDELEMGCKRIYLALDGDRVVAMAMTTVERRDAAMIVSVCTHPDYRGRGLAGAVMTALCRELAEEGKTALLFYNNPVAGRIYRSLGFRDLGRWCSASFR